VGDGELLYGGEIWLEGEDVIYGSDGWNTIDMDFTIEDVNVNKVVLLEIGFDGIGNGSVLIDNVVFGDYDVTYVIDAVPDAVFQVYPNPANDFLRIRNTGQVFDVTIFNVAGQQMMHVKNQEEINISALDKGLYFIQVASKGLRETYKVLVE
jgi:hypothetical protein